MRQFGRADHAGRNRLAVQPRSVAKYRLKTVGKGVAVIQDGPEAGGFAFIVTHHRSFQLA